VPSPRRRNHVFSSSGKRVSLATLGQVLHDLTEAVLDRILERGCDYVLRGHFYRTRKHREELTRDDFLTQA
jgi:DNA replication protein DnaC